MLQIWLLYDFSFLVCAHARGSAAGRWRFVIHGGVDGYSRAIVYLGVSDNNRAATVLNLFKHAVADWGLPSRVRCFYFKCCYMYPMNLLFILCVVFRTVKLMH